MAFRLYYSIVQKVIHIFAPTLDDYLIDIDGSGNVGGVSSQDF